MNGDRGDYLALLSEAHALLNEAVKAAREVDDPHYGTLLKARNYVGTGLALARTHAAHTPSEPSS